jgi:hypothetical protein
VTVEERLVERMHQAERRARRGLYVVFGWPLAIPVSGLVSSNVAWAMLLGLPLWLAVVGYTTYHGWRISRIRRELRALHELPQARLLDGPR